jgi:putative transposase
MTASRRLIHRDYSSPGLYFVTVCSDFKRCTFGEVENGRVRLSALGRIVEEAWIGLARRMPYFRLRGHVVMPNHVHGMIEILKVAQQAAPLQTRGGALGGTTVPSLSIIVRSFKADVTRRAGVELKWDEEIWQRNYYDRVIRDGREFSNAVRYMAENPARWEGQVKKWEEEKLLKENSQREKLRS